MIKKITDRDKEDWQNFLKNNEKIPNKDFVIKKKYLRDIKIKEISDKDKKDWENFLENKDKIPNKDFVNKKNRSSWLHNRRSE